VRDILGEEKIEATYPEEEEVKLHTYLEEEEVRLHTWKRRK
jgi:hypothetical protein